MKRTLLFTFTLLFSSLFIGCDDNGGNDDGNDNGNDVVKLVKSMTVDSKALYEFEYDDQQRITKAVTDFGEDSQSLVYGEDVTTLTRDGKEPFKLYFDTAGYLKTLEFDEDESLEYTYSEDGYLENVLWVWGDEEDDKDTYLFEWNDGNLVKVKLNGEEVETLEYGDKPNKLSVNFNPYIIGEIGLYNFKGTFNKNLPVSRSFIVDGESNTIEYEYTFDEDGYPDSIKETDSDGDSQTITVTYYQH